MLRALLFTLEGDGYVTGLRSERRNFVSLFALQAEAAVDFQYKEVYYYI